MRILVTADPELPVPPRLYGGIERIVDRLIAELRGRGHIVGLVARSDSTAEADALFGWPGASSAARTDSLRNASALRRAVAEFEPDVLHSFSRLLYLLPLATSRVPRLMSYQRLPTRRTVAWSNRLAGGGITFTGCSEYICREGRRGGGRWVAIPNFVDLAAYDFRAAVPDDAPLVFLSRVERIKGAHLAIAAARGTGRRLLIAGNHATDGEHGQYWREEIEPHLGHDGIEYVGPVDDAQKNALLGRAAAMLVPIEWEEPFGIVFIEALACGTPVISCPRGALPEIVRDGAEGFLCEALDAICHAIDRVPTIDRRACRARVESSFSSAAVASRYQALYEEVCACVTASNGVARR